MSFNGDDSFDKTANTVKIVIIVVAVIIGCVVLATIGYYLRRGSQSQWFRGAFNRPGGGTHATLANDAATSTAATSQPSPPMYNPNDQGVIRGPNQPAYGAGVQGDAHVRSYTQWANSAGVRSWS